MAGDFRPELLAYQNALERAWLDGVITYDEATMLDSLREHLLITDEEHWSMENDIKAKGPAPGIQEYRSALEQAWMDGILTDLEKGMLTRLREKYDITDELHETLENKVKSELNLDNGTPDALHPGMCIDILEREAAMEVDTNSSSEMYWTTATKNFNQIQTYSSRLYCRLDCDVQMAKSEITMWMPSITLWRGN